MERSGAGSAAQQLARRSSAKAEAVVKKPARPLRTSMPLALPHRPPITHPPVGRTRTPRLWLQRVISHRIQRAPIETCNQLIDAGYVLPVDPTHRHRSRMATTPPGYSSGRASSFLDPMVLSSVALALVQQLALAQFRWPQEVYPHPYLMRGVAYYGRRRTR
jgi:hypothetical protein